MLISNFSCDGFSNPLPTREDLCVARAMVSILVGSEYHRNYFGSTYADERTQAMVQEIKNRMGFAISFEVHVMYLNTQGFKQFGVENLIATHNTIFIDHTWFDALPIDEQRFLIAHELAHIYTRDVRTVSLLVLASSAVIGYKLYQYLSDQESLGAYLGLLGFFTLVLPSYGRYTEQRADANGANALRTKEGGIALFKQWIKDQRVRQELSRLEQFYEDMVATHPTHERRLEALEALQIAIT